jgi:hypothetical protein
MAGGEAMTPEREDEIRAAATRRGRYIDGIRLRDLLAEIDALRRLPVIAMCGDCGHLGGGYPDATCTHIDAGADEPPTVEHVSPPSWCPLRGAR